MPNSSEGFSEENKISVLKNKLGELHPVEGDLHNGGIDSIGTFAGSDDKKAVAYSRENKRAFLDRGLGEEISKSRGMTYEKGLSVFDGNTDIEIKPVTMWRDGEGAGGDQPENNWGVEEFKKEEGSNKYKLVIRNGNDNVEIVEVDFDSGEAKTIDGLEYSEYLDEKNGIKTEGMSDFEKGELIGGRIKKKLIDSISWATEDDHWVLGYSNKFKFEDNNLITEDLKFNKYLGKIEDDKFLLEVFLIAERVPIPGTYQVGLFLIDPKSLRIKEIDAWHPSVDKNSGKYSRISNIDYNKDNNTISFTDPHSKNGEMMTVSL